MEHSNGPDQVLPIEEIYTTSLTGATKIKDFDMDLIPPRSVPTMFEKICSEFPKRTAMSYKVNGRWQDITYEKYRHMVRCCAKGFLHLGLTSNAVVCILGFNSPEWFVADLAAIYAGGVAAGIYTTNSPEACLYCFNHSKARIVVVEGTYIGKILQIRKEASTVMVVIQYGNSIQLPDVILWEKFMELGEKISDSVLDEALHTIAINQCCTLIYTSGTTGNPKGVMLSHDNIVYSSLKIGEKLGLTRNPMEIYVSYLPLSHVAGNIVDIHCCFMWAAKVYFADKDALKGSLMKTLKEVKPTRILSVPRVWEKVYEKFQQRKGHSRGLKKCLEKWAKKEGLKKNLALEKQHSAPMFYFIARALFFRKIKALFGIGKCKSIICGAAPLSTEVKLYLAGLDVLVLEAFGMSETSSLHCTNTTEKFRFDGCGTPCRGMFTFIDEPDEDGIGELCIFGRHVFMGYLDDEKQTKEAIDKYGYLHSGDLARMDKWEYVYITGRLKDIIITAGGENVAPTLIEENIKAALPFIGYSVVIGDRRKFLSVLITLSTEIDENEEPTDLLSSDVRRWLTGLGLKYTTMKEVLDSGPHDKIKNSIQNGLDTANLKAISNAQKVQKFALLPSDFSIATGELGPTLKVKREVVIDKYKSIVDGMYRTVE